MLDTKTRYSYNDITIVPAIVSNIEHRGECNPFIDGEKKLPIFASPMSGVVNEDNFPIFEENGITPILPRDKRFDLATRYKYCTQGKWAAFSLNETIECFCTDRYEVGRPLNKYRILIDIANGHMNKLYEVVKRIRDNYKNEDVEIMVGNIANPKTYIKAMEAGVDYIRCTIGTGSCCITSSNVAIHYPPASLLDEIAKIKQNIIENSDEDIKLPKIIADGGIRNYSDVIKALALGADYVMIGGLFAALEESAGEIAFKNGVRCKKFFGMASADGQVAIDGKKTKTAEGITKYIPVTTTISKWKENMIAYLRSTMSYCDINDIHDFNYQNVQTIVISQNSKESVNK